MIIPVVDNKNGNIIATDVTQDGNDQKTVTFHDKTEKQRTAHTSNIFGKNAAIGSYITPANEVTAIQKAYG